MFDQFVLCYDVTLDNRSAHETYILTCTKHILKSISTYTYIRLMKLGECYLASTIILTVLPWYTTIPIATICVHSTVHMNTTVGFVLDLAFGLPHEGSQQVFAEM